LILAVRSHETFSALIKVLFKKCLRFLPLLIRPLGLITQALKLGFLIIFVNNLFLTFFVNSYKVCEFCKIILSTKLYLFQAACSIIPTLSPVSAALTPTLAAF